MNTAQEDLPHQIRLAGPWLRTVISEANASSVRVTPPLSITDDLGPEFSGVVEYQRFFHQPTGLDGKSLVYLVLEQVVGNAVEISLNDQVLGNWNSTIEFPLRIAVGTFLARRNDLRVRVEDHANPTNRHSAREVSGLLGPVRLEIFDGDR